MTNAHDHYPSEALNQWAEQPDPWAELSDDALFGVLPEGVSPLDDEHRKLLGHVAQANAYIAELESDKDAATKEEWRAARKRRDEAWRNALDYEQGKGMQRPE